MDLGDGVRGRKKAPCVSSRRRIDAVRERLVGQPSVRRRRKRVDAGMPLELEQSTAVITTDSTYVYLYVYESKGKTYASGVCQTSDGLMLLIAAEKQ